jgi:hypothetical protein
MISQGRLEPWVIRLAIRCRAHACDRDPSRYWHRRERHRKHTVTTRPVKGEVPTLDLVIAYHESNNSPILKLLLSRVGKLAGAPS